MRGQPHRFGASFEHITDPKVAHIPDRSAYLWIIFPLAPLVAGFLALALINGTITPDTSITPHLPGAPTFHPDGREMRFFAGLMTFVSVGLFHVFACVTVMALMALRIAQMPPKVRAQALTILAAIIMILVLVNVMARQPALIGGLTLTYRNICTVVLAGGVAAHLLPTSCTGEGVSAFAWLALLPYLFGLLAAACAAAVTSMAYRPVTQDDVQGELDRRARIVEQAFQGTAFVLVTSTITMMLFYKLPLTLIRDEAALALMTGYAQGMALFWGVIFTLTLIAIFGPGNLILQRQLRDRHETAAVPEALTTSTVRKQLISTLTTMAPLLIGASGSVLEQLAGAL